MGLQHCFILVFVFYLQGFSQGDKVCRVIPENEAQANVIAGLEQRSDIKVDFWTHPSGIGRPVDIEVSDSDYDVFSAVLSREGIPFSVQIPDVQRLLDNERAPGARSSSYHSTYHNLYEIHQKLEALANSRRGMSRVFSIGRSYEGRDMKAIEIKGKPKFNKPVFFWECGIHAREWISPATCVYSIEQMIYKYGRDNSVTALLDKMDFIILPVFNVDGYAYTWKGSSRSYRMWRKNRRPNGGCVGTDLNRNWDHKWGYTGASPRPCDSTYRGSRPFSEVETQNAKRYLESLGDRLKGFIDMHAYSQMWFTPWGYTARRTPDYREQYRVARIASQAIQGAGYGTRYKYGSSAALLYAAAGGSEDWVYAKLDVKYAFSVELRDTGRYGFILPPDQILPTGIETFEGVKALVRAMNV